MQTVDTICAASDVLAALFFIHAADLNHEAFKLMEVEESRHNFTGQRTVMSLHKDAFSVLKEKSLKLCLAIVSVVLYQGLK